MQFSGFQYLHHVVQPSPQSILGFWQGQKGSQVSKDKDYDVEESVMTQEAHRSVNNIRMQMKCLDLVSDSA